MTMPANSRADFPREQPPQPNPIRQPKLARPFGAFPIDTLDEKTVRAIKSRHKIKALTVGKTGRAQAMKGFNAGSTKSLYRKSPTASLLYQ